MSDETSRIERVLAGKAENHIAPFLWIHGEDEETLREEIARIQDSGIGALCVEARPHKDFGGPGWFHDLEVILDECRTRGVGMWLLDDSHFPTGFANGEVMRNHPELCKKYLKLTTFDLVGPVESAGVNLKYCVAPGDVVLAALLQRRIGFGEIDPDETIDVTASVHSYDDYNTGRPNVNPIGDALPGVQGACTMASFDVPDGDWCLNVLTVSFSGGEKETEGYLNPIDPAATQVLLDTIYQPVYEHFSADFGKTFRGFFSDEPRFGNIHGSEDASIGRNPAMPLPWRDDLAGLLVTECDGGILGGLDAEGIKPYLPLLFSGEGVEAHAIRFAYMELVSRLYSENFDQVIAAWCHGHSVEHIGHTIEDNDACARLGYGAGHFYRAMANADMAGIDVVIQQLMPGQDKGMYQAFHKPGWDGEFFTYLLGKLGGSLAHLDPKKRGRCMAEVFGAYGWAEGNRLAKWICDYMLVRGVNELVPHAFDPAPFPDGDCPPHFWAHGHNPQYPEFKLLMGYANRMCDLLSGGIHVAPVALLFHAEAEWSGEYSSAQRPAAELARGQVDYDVVSRDYLLGADCVNGSLHINGETFRALVVPFSEALPQDLLARIVEFADSCLLVYFVDGLPLRTSEGVDPQSLVEKVAARCKVVSNEGLVPAVRADGVAELSVSGYSPYLRHYHYRHADADLYLFVNEHPGTRVVTEVTGTASGTTYVYDAFENTLVPDDAAFSLDLPPFGSRLVVVSRTTVGGASNARTAFSASETIGLGSCELSLAPMESCCKEWGSPIVLEKPVYVSSMVGYEGFAGRIRYRFSVVLDAAQASRSARLALGGVREGATVTVNGTPAGTRIVPDYVFCLGDALVEGENEILVELNTTLGHAMNDFMSQFMPVEPTGMTKAILELGE